MCTAGESSQWLALTAVAAAVNWPERLVYVAGPVCTSAVAIAAHTLQMGPRGAAVCSAA